MDDVGMLTINEYAKFFGVSVRTVHRMITENTIDALDLNNGRKKKSLWRIPVKLSGIKSNERRIA